VSHRTAAAAAYDKTRCRRLKNPPPPQNTYRRRLKPRRRRRQKSAIFLRFRLYGSNDHDNLDHGYIMIGYLDIDIKNTVYNNSRTPVNSVCVVICVQRRS
jgi:hypothetical protein